MRPIPVIVGSALLALAGWLSLRTLGLDGSTSSSGIPGRSHPTAPSAVMDSGSGPIASPETEESSAPDLQVTKLKASSRPSIIPRGPSSLPLAEANRNARPTLSPDVRPQAIRETESLTGEVVSAPETFHAVDPTSPGNTLVHADRKITINGYQSNSEGNTLVADLLDFPSPASPFRNAGFTSEEEAFRTKWGWAAFSQIQRTAEAEETR